MEDQRQLAVLFFNDPDAGPTSEALGKLRRVERFKRNPRSPDYMRRLARVTLSPRCDFIDVPAASDASSMLTAARLESADEIVLLWPDAIGQGWAPIENLLFAAKRAKTTVSVLNGRRRRFDATPTTLFVFRVRRIIEQLWVGEMAFGAALLLAAPFLVAWDTIRGHR